MFRRRGNRLRKVRIFWRRSLKTLKLTVKNLKPGTRVTVRAQNAKGNYKALTRKQIKKL